MPDGTCQAGILVASSDRAEPQVDARLSVIILEASRSSASPGMTTVILASGFAPRFGYASPPETRRGMERRSALHLFARLARGARCPEPPGTRLTALHRGSRQGPLLGPLAQPRTALPGTRADPVPVQRAPRRAVLVPPGRGSGVARVRGTSLARGNRSRSHVEHVARRAPRGSRRGELNGARRSADKVFAEIFEVIAPTAKFRAGVWLYAPLSAIPPPLIPAQAGIQSGSPLSRGRAAPNRKDVDGRDKPGHDETTK